MKMNAQIPLQWWERMRWARGGFFAGLLLGVVVGWLFHGIISFVLQFGLVLVLLLPLLVIGWLWWRSSRSSAAGEQTTTVMSWRGGEPPTQGGPANPRWEPDGEPEGTIPTQGRMADPPREPWRQANRPIPTDFEAELEALKREQERRR